MFCEGLRSKGSHKGGGCSLQTLRRPHTPPMDIISNERVKTSDSDALECMRYAGLREVNAEGWRVNGRGGGGLRPPPPLDRPISIC